MFAWMSFLFGEMQFTNFVSEEIATARCRHTSKRRRIPMPASARRRARCYRHDARAGIVALTLCCLVRVSTGGLGPPGDIVSLPACTQQIVRRGAAPSSRLEPLSFCKARPLQSTVFRCAQRNCYLRSQATSESTSQDIISPQSSFSARAAGVPLLDWLPARVVRDFCNHEDPDALGDDSVLRCDPATVARLCSKNASL